MKYTKNETRCYIVSLDIKKMWMEGLSRYCLVLFMIFELNCVDYTH